MRNALGTGRVPVAALILAWLGLACRPAAEPPPAREGLALAIVYDTSGSMADSVANAAGKPEPKYKIAARAADSIFDQLEVYVRDAAPGTVREVQAELIVLDNIRARRAMRMQPFQSAAFKERIESLSKPGGGTPLGNALKLAASDLLASPLTRKHILVVTDGENTEGPAPERVWPGIREESQARGAGIQLHFVAFDVAAQVFAPVKQLGATVAGAGDEIQLKERLEYILQKKILLENEEPPLKE